MGGKVSPGEIILFGVILAAMDRNAGEGEMRVGGEPFKGGLYAGGEGFVVADLGANDVAGVLVDAGARGGVRFGVHGVLFVLVVSVA